MKNIGFIGVGHMASSIISAIKDNQDICLYLNNRSIDKAIKLSKEISNSKVATYEEIFKNCDYIFIGVKPIDLDDVLHLIKDNNYQGIVISMVAGSTINDINKIINNKIIRILPNTPVAVKSGVTLITYSSSIDIEEKDFFISLMKETGELVEVEENKINPISVITGSAPAYLDYFIDALIKAGVEQGLEEKEITYLTLKMIEGTIKLNLNSNKTPLELGKEVATPNGSTIEGINVLINKDIYKIVKEAYLATLNKNNKMI